MTDVDRPNFDLVDFGLRGKAALPFVLLPVYVRVCVYLCQNLQSFFLYINIYVLNVVWTPPLPPQYNFHHVMCQGTADLCHMCDPDKSRGRLLSVTSIITHTLP